jgi:SPP1 family predicted phage head-tail adaptor
MIAAGKLDRRITIRRQAQARDAYGELVKDELGHPVLEWCDMTTVWASKTDIRDAERIAAQQVGSTITSRFQIRWSERVDDLTPRDRLRYPAISGPEWNITAVKEIGRREGLEITAAARNN